MSESHNERLLEIFFRALKGEALSVQRLAGEYEVSTKSITRTLNDLKAFLADHRDLVGHAELQYSSRDKCYRLNMDDFLSSKEMFALLEVMIGARAFSKDELLVLTDKLKQFTAPKDRPAMGDLIRKELYQYNEVRHDCDSVQDMLWLLASCITDRKEVTIEYYKMDRTIVTHRLKPASVMFTDYYFYLIAFKAGENTEEPRYFRVDRIRNIVVHRGQIAPGDLPVFDEGKLRQRSLYMWPGPLRTIRFEFTGPSLQAVLDKIPTAKVIKRSGEKALIEAEVYGDGIKMWLLSQGAWIKVISPDEFVQDMKKSIAEMAQHYESSDNA